MISFGTKRYIKKYAKNNNLDLPSNYLNYLRAYSDIAKKYSCKLHFHGWRKATIKIPAIDAGFFSFSPIVATPGYAVLLLFDESGIYNEAFLMSLGHEITHKENDINPWRYCGNNQKFVAHVNEVHADFGAVSKLGNGDSTRQIRAMALKRKDKIKRKKKDVSNQEPPSWKKRMEYIQNKVFDETLIRRIAADVDCTNEKLIQKVINHFDEIYLR